MTKWKCLYNALADNQNKCQDGNTVLSFIAKALQPTKSVNNRNRYDLMIRGALQWDLEEQDALDIFTLASYVLRRIDNSHP